MSIKSFHIVFTFSVAMLLLFLSIWNLNSWIEYRSSESLNYAVLSFFLIGPVYRYGKNFVSKVTDID